MTMPEQKNSIVQILTSWKAMLTLISGIVALGLGIRYAFWEYSDKLEERRQRITEAQREQDNLEQAYLLRKILKSDLDSLTASFSRTNEIILEQSIKKDSMLLVVVPVLMQRISQTSLNVEKLHHKFDLLMDKETDVDKAYFLQILNTRDSIAIAQARKDSMDALMMREIRRISRHLLNPRPKYGDRSE